jgi:hypothetical protein
VPVTRLVLAGNPLDEPHDTAIVLVIGQGIAARFRRFKEPTDGGPVQPAIARAVVKQLVRLTVHDRRRDNDIAAPGLEVQVMTRQASARLISAREVDVQPTGRGPDQCTCPGEQPGPLQAAKCLKPAAAISHVHIENIGPGVARRDGEVKVRACSPHSPDALGQVGDAVRLGPGRYPADQWYSQAC